MALMALAPSAAARCPGPRAFRHPTVRRRNGAALGPAAFPTPPSASARARAVPDRVAIGNGSNLLYRPTACSTDDVSDR